MLLYSPQAHHEHPGSKLVRSKTVADAIQTKILDGRLPKGVKLPSERKLAEELGVSRASVQAAIKELQSQGFLSRQTNCRPVVMDGPEQANSVQAADQIAVWMLPDTQDLGGVMILDGIRAELSNQQFNLLFASPPSYDQATVRYAELQFLRSVRDDERVAGVITWDTGNPECSEIYRDLVRQQKPLVFIDREPQESIAADVVSANHRKGARQAVQSLLEIGHRSIAMVIGLDRASSVIERIDGYESSLRAWGIPPDPKLIREVNGLANKISASCDELFDEWISSANPPTAIFAVNDRIAFYLMDSAKRKGISIPEQFSLIGFDWLLRWMPSGGDLTTVAQPFEEIGRLAGSCLLNRMKSKFDYTPRLILLDTSLVTGSTTTSFTG